MAGTEASQPGSQAGSARMLLPLSQADPSNGWATPVRREAGSTVDDTMATMESVYAEALERSQVARQAAEASLKECKEKMDEMQVDLEKQRAALEEERQAWHDERKKLKKSLETALEALAQRLPPTAHPGTARAATRAPPMSSQESSADLSISSASDPMGLSSPIYSEASSIGRVICGDDMGSGRSTPQLETRRGVLGRTGRTPEGSGAFSEASINSLPAVAEVKEPSGETLAQLASAAASLSKPRKDKGGYTN